MSELVEALMKDIPVHPEVRRVDVQEKYKLYERFGIESAIQLPKIFSCDPGLAQKLENVSLGDVVHVSGFGYCVIVSRP